MTLKLRGQAFAMAFVFGVIYALVQPYITYLIATLINKENKIKIERTIKDLTQEELAKRIGVSRQTINSIETNRYVPSTFLALKLSQVFDKPVNDFFFFVRRSMTTKKPFQ